MARVRSPNYPALSLPEAIERARDIYKVQQKTAEPREVVLKHMGYSGVSGRSLKALSALIKYGLLEPAGDGRLRISKRAIAILYPDPEDPKAQQSAMLDAAHGPALFHAIFEKWSSRPSEASMDHFLTSQDFNLNSKEQVARAFYDTYDLVSGWLKSYDSGGREQADDDDEEDDVVEQTAEVKPKSGTASGKSQQPSVNSTKPIFDFETVTISTSIDNQEDLEELLFRLEKVKPMLPKKNQD